LTPVETEMVLKNVSMTSPTYAYFCLKTLFSKMPDCRKWPFLVFLTPQTPPKMPFSEKPYYRVAIIIFQKSQKSCFEKCQKTESLCP
jgi:hypothetical protein